ncbi:hypothetical protein AB6A40_005554 [Gnathostoma spinigerum]|uniref:Uncharacterized protein n=1 Tax=Gnathostoma spinigerum TaxID=75299 RepID=A0ABD6EFS0_9BILA
MIRLLTTTVRPLSQQYYTRSLLTRCFAVMATPPPAKVKLNVSNEEGHFEYERYWSRDKRFAPQRPGDTPARFLLRRLGHAYEVYPLIFLVGAWFCAFCVIAYVSLGKVEVWLDRGQKKAPWDWERIRDNYYKQHTVIYDIFGNTHGRLEIMEKLQDAMTEAAKKRGTR